ncbi:MAG: hypothetical protein ACRCX2_29380, partial [Paraclostridium sp.]
ANSITVLENNEYVGINISDYDYSSYNICSGSEVLKYKRINKSNYIKELLLNFKGNVGNFSYFLDDNFIVFYNTENNGDKYFYHFSSIYEVKDVKIDENMFVHIIYKFENCDYYIKSSLYLPFATLNSNDSVFEEEYFLEKIKMCNEVEEIINREFNEMNFYNKDRDIVSVKFSKKYYFESEGLIYFNHSDIYDNVKDSLVKSFVQINNLNLYSYISMLGLNDFKTINNMKISSIDGIFENLFKNRFNNTLNGGINYFNAKNINTKRDYCVNVKDEFFAINGNFIPKSNLKARYKFKIFKNVCSLFICNEKGEELAEQLRITGETFYMCNLKFEYLRFDELKEPYIFEVSNLEPYPFNLVTNSNIVFDRVYNDKKTSSRSMSNVKLEGFDNHNTEAYFDGKKIIIKNAYNFEEKKYLFDDHKVTVEANKKLKISEFDDFKTTIPFSLNNEYLYPRASGEVSYTTMSSFDLPLVNSSGFITDYWIKNQGEEVYLKLGENKVMITNKKNECDFYFTVPFINDMVLNESEYTIIAIEDNNDYESEWDANSNSLITDRFMNNPLFSMWFVENTETVDIYTVDKKKLENVIKEPYNGGLIVYFDSLDETLYYNTKDSNYNYFNPLKSYENITSAYSFDENLEVSFEKVRSIENFTLECDKNVPENEEINLIMYNSVSGETFKLTLSSNELSKPFALGISIDSMSIEKTKVLEGSKFNFKITKVNSVLKNGKITYIKGDINNPVFQAISKPRNMNFKTYKGIKVDTKYEYMINGEMRESYKGDLIIRPPFNNEITIFKRNNFKYYFKKESYCILSEKDNFYLSNFRTPGLLAKTHSDSEDIKITNSRFELGEIIDKNSIKK